jgi:hypothetical protein
MDSHVKERLYILSMSGSGVDQLMEGGGGQLLTVCSVYTTIQY